MADEHLRLSVLDQSPVSEGSSGAQALQNTLDLARLADRLGYHRYWVAEHHGGPMLAGPSPEALIGPIAAATTNIRVGSGGVMLPHYSPFKVAETFSLLAGLFPGRIDLALGRAAGTDPLTSFALQRDRRAGTPDDFPAQLVELLGYLDDRLGADHPFARLAKTLPGRPERPEPWLLGSSPQSALWAAELGLPYAFADFINAGGAEITALYRERFAEHEHADSKPRTAVAVWVICADSDEEARRLAASAA
jgi:luciferase family oxidoreductase group 1